MMVTASTTSAASNTNSNDGLSGMVATARLDRKNNSSNENPLHKPFKTYCQETSLHGWKYVLQTSR